MRSCILWGWWRVLRVKFMASLWGFIFKAFLRVLFELDSLKLEGNFNEMAVDVFFFDVLWRTPCLLSFWHPF